MWEAVGSSAQEYLGRLSLLTAPAPWDVLLYVEPQTGTGRALVRAGLLSPFRHAGRYREALASVDRVLQAEPSGQARGLALTFQVQLARMAGVPPADAEARLSESEKLFRSSSASWASCICGVASWPAPPTHSYEPLRRRRS